MPSDPDNNRMDEALKVFARKRRDDAGAPFELHPATRNLLQGEVARTYAKPDADKRSWLQMVAMFWPRLAFAAAVVAVLGVVCWVSFPSFRSPSQPAKLARNEKLAPAPDSPSAVTDEPRFTQEQLDLFNPTRDNADKSAARGAAAAGGQMKKIDSVSVKLAEREKLAETDSFFSLPKPVLAGNAPAAPPAAPRPVPNSSAEPANEALKATLITEVRANVAPPGIAGGGGGAAGYGGIGIQPAKPDAKNAPYDLFFQTAPRDDGAMHSFNGSATTLTNLPRTLTYLASDASASDRYGNDNKLGALGTTLSLPPPDFPMRELKRAESLSRQALPEKGVVTKANYDFGLNPNEAKRPVSAGQLTVAPEGVATLSAINPSPALGARPAAAVEAVAGAGLAGTENLKFRRELGESSGNRMTAENAQRYYRAKTVSTDREDTTAAASKSLLASFDFDQNGDSIRIRDADGSVYEGRTVTAVETTAFATGLGDDKKVQPQVKAGRESQLRRIEDLSKQKAETAFGRSFRFRVSGTNHNLKQLVVLDGVMTSEGRASGAAQTNGRTANFRFTESAVASPRVAKNLASAARDGFELKPAGAAAAPTKPADPAPVPLARIKARARIGSATNEVEINAIRVAR